MAQFTRNPIIITVMVFILVLILVGTNIGISVATIAQHIFVPYTVNISRGIGDSASGIFRGVIFAIQMIIAGVILLSSESGNRAKKTLFVLLGIVLVVLYFLLVVVAYVAPRFH